MKSSCARTSMAVIPVCGLSQMVPNARSKRSETNEKGDHSEPGSTDANEKDRQSDHSVLATTLEYNLFPNLLSSSITNIIINRCKRLIISRRISTRRLRFDIRIYNTYTHTHTHTYVGSHSLVNQSIVPCAQLCGF